MRLDTAIEESEITKADIVYREEYDAFTKTIPTQFKAPDEVKNAFAAHHDSIEGLNNQVLSLEEKEAIQSNINYSRTLILEVADEIANELFEQGVYTPSV